MTRHVWETHRFGPFELRPRDYALTRIPEEVDAIVRKALERPLENRY